MGEARRITVDGNEAAASVAHRLSEVIAIYPFARLGALAQKNADQRYALYQQLAAIKAPEPAAKPEPEPVEA